MRKSKSDRTSLIYEYRLVLYNSAISIVASTNQYG